MPCLSLVPCIISVMPNEDEADIPDGWRDVVHPRRHGVIADPGLLPQVLLPGRGHALPSGAAAALLRMIAMSQLDAPYEGLKVIADECDRGSLAAMVSYRALGHLSAIAFNANRRRRAPTPLTCSIASPPTAGSCPNNSMTCSHPIRVSTAPSRTATKRRGWRRPWSGSGGGRLATSRRESPRIRFSAGSRAS